MSIQLMKAKFKQLTRKDFVIVGLTLVVIVLFFQKVNLQEEFDEVGFDYQQQISELEEKVQSQQEHIKQTNELIKEVSSDVDRFEYEDWRNVVPDVYSSVKELDSNIELAPIEDSGY